MQRIVAAALLMILALAAAIATAQLMNRQWIIATQIYSIDASDSYVTLDSAGKANFQIVLRNTGTIAADIGRIVIIDGSVEILFSGGQAQLHFYDSGTTFAGTVSFSNPNEAKVDDTWLTLPPGQSVFMTFQATNVGAIMSVGSSYMVTVYPHSGGEVLTFRLVVESA